MGDTPDLAVNLRPNSTSGIAHVMHPSQLIAMEKLHQVIKTKWWPVKKNSKNLELFMQINASNTSIEDLLLIHMLPNNADIMG